MSSIRPLGRMLISKDQGRELDIDIDKVAKGSFFTTETLWLSEQVRSFLLTALTSTDCVLDPFAGNGDLLTALGADPQLAEKISEYQGLDISGERWPKNDSLLKIANPKAAVIVTNPPYLANHSAKRKSVLPLVEKYFRPGQDNLYKVALANCLAVADYVVAIIPETFLLSSFPKQRLELAVVIEQQLFADTEAPALIACFAPGRGSQQVFLGNQKVAALPSLLELRESQTSFHRIIFNSRTGQLALRAVDGANGASPIAFSFAEDFEYPKNRIRVSSRLMTYIELPGLENDKLKTVIEIANRELTRIRKESFDLVLAPFKGNDVNGKRRRRLDYALARKILNLALEEIAQR